MSGIDAASIKHDISIFEQSSPESLRAQARARALSPHAHHELSSTSNDYTQYVDTEDDWLSDEKPTKQCTSSRSSISSFPASVIHTVPLTDNEDVGFRTPSRSQSYDRTTKPPGPAYLSAFRRPNSVRALQLDSEVTDSDVLSPRNSPRPSRSPNVSYFGTRSPASIHALSTKRSSRPGTPQQRTQSNSKLKKEAFPLVLLHCTLLAPAVTTRGPTVSDEILEAVLPEEYRKRWRTLQDKVIKNNEVKQRGVLIPHPREEYDLLEESLLETLELERPRIRRGHYLGSNRGEGSDSGFESSSQNSTDEISDPGDKVEDQTLGDKCPDCGTTVSCETEQARKWEVKVFAANGLMKSGAWAAAWEQMEKIDVEVGVWMPEDVRLEVEERLKALQAKEEAEQPLEEPTIVKRKNRGTRSITAKIRHDERMREIYGDPPGPKTQEEIDGLLDGKGKPEPASSKEHCEPDATPPVVPATSHAALPTQAYSHTVPVQEGFATYTRRYLSLIWNDQKNLVIVLLSMLVLFFSVSNINAPIANSKQVETWSHEPGTEGGVSSSGLITDRVMRGISPVSVHAPASETEVLSVAAAQQNSPMSEAWVKQSVVEVADAAASTPESAGAFASDSGQRLQLEREKSQDSVDLGSDMDTADEAQPSCCSDNLLTEAVDDSVLFSTSTSNPADPSTYLIDGALTEHVEMELECSEHQSGSCRNTADKLLETADPYVDLLLVNNMAEAETAQSPFSPLLEQSNSALENTMGESEMLW